MIKLTKTEEALLREAVQYQNGSVSATRAYGKGCKGIEGVRATSALAKLRDKGLVGELTVYQSKETHRGWSTFYTSLSATITDAGRAYVEGSAR